MAAQPRIDSDLRQAIQEGWPQAYEGSFTMDSDQRLFAVGAFINGALFLLMAFALGAIEHNRTAMLMVLLAAAAAFYAYVLQIMRLPLAGWIGTGASWLMAAAAFVLLTVG